MNAASLVWWKCPRRALLSVVRSRNTVPIGLHRPRFPMLAGLHLAFDGGAIMLTEGINDPSRAVLALYDDFPTERELVQFEIHQLR